MKRCKSAGESALSHDTSASPPGRSFVVKPLLVAAVFAAGTWVSSSAMARPAQDAATTPPSESVGSPEWQELNRQSDALRRERAALLIDLTPEHPAVHSVELRLAEVERQIEQVPRQAVAPQPRGPASTLRPALAAADAQADPTYSLERLMELARRMQAPASQPDRPAQRRIDRAPPTERKHVDSGPPAAWLRQARQWMQSAAAPESSPTKGQSYHADRTFSASNSFSGNRPEFRTENSGSFASDNEAHVLSGFKILSDLAVFSGNTVFSGNRISVDVNIERSGNRVEGGKADKNPGAFERLDTNGDGQISLQEFRRALP